MVTLRRALVALAPLVVLGGCRAIAGLHDLEYTPTPSCTAPVLPTVGSGKIRLVNVGVTGSSTDFCVRAGGTSDWGTPILASPTLSCDTGLAYASATVPFAVAAGKIDVEAIATGQPCSAKATSEIDDVAVGDTTKGAPVVTLMRYGGGSTAEALSALPESVGDPQPEVSAVGIRVANALSSTRSIEWGLSSTPTRPATVDTPVDVNPIPPGASTPASATASIAVFDASGYAYLAGAAFHFAAFYADDGAESAIAIGSLFDGAAVGTLYVIGDPGDAQNLHPVTGLLCADDISLAGSPTRDAGAADAAAAPADTRILADCQLAALPSFSVDVINVDLLDLDLLFQAQRRPHIYRDIAARTSSFMCVVEASDVTDRAAIADAAKAGDGGAGQFPYSFTVTTDDSTPPSNPSDTGPAPTDPPCGPNVVPSATVDDVYTCVEQYCSTVPGGDPNGDGVLNGTTDCLTTSCVRWLAPIYTSPITSETSARARANDACFNCILYNLLSAETLVTGASAETIGQGEVACTTQTTPPFVLGGQTPVLILSHYPIVGTSAYYLPSTGYRRAILKAQAQVEDGRTIDFFCGDLIYAFIDSQLPYTGIYGNDVAADGGLGNGWEDEQDLEATESLAWIQAQIAADGVPAIVAMDLQSNDAVVDAGVGPNSPEVVHQFNATLTPALAPNASPLCDVCPEPINPYTQTVPPEFLHTYLSGFPDNATQSDTLWATDPSEVPIPPNLPDQQQPPGGTGTLSFYPAHDYVFVRPSP